MIEELNKAIEEGIPSYVHRAVQPTFDWNTAVGYLTHCADVELGEPIGILNYRLPLADDVESIKPVKEYLSENLSRGILGVDMYVTLTTKSDVKYHGKDDVLIWNALGYSEFELNGNNRLLEPGDVVFIPRDTEYKITPMGHRTFVVFSLEKGKENGSNETL